MANDKIWQYGLLGAIAVLVNMVLFKLISAVLSAIPGLSVNLQSVSIDANVSGALGTGLGKYAQNLFGMAGVTLPLQTYIIAAIGGALFVMLGYLLVEWAGQLEGSKLRKLTTILVTAGIISGFVLSWSISVPALTVVFAMIVDAVALSWIYITLDNMAGTKLVPD